MTDEQLTDEERAMIAEYPWPRTPQAAAHEKILRLHDRLKARVDSLLVERNLALSALWRIAGTPAGAVDLTMIERAEARVRELEDLLDEAGDCMGLDAVDMVGRIDAALGRVKAPG